MNPEYPSHLNPLDSVLWHFTAKDLTGFDVVCRQHCDSQAYVIFQGIRLGSLSCLVGLSSNSFIFNLNITEELLKLCKLNSVAIKPEFSLEKINQEMAQSLIKLNTIHGFGIKPDVLKEYDQVFKNYQKALLILQKLGAVESKASRFYPEKHELSLLLTSENCSRNFQDNFYSTPDWINLHTYENKDGTHLSLQLNGTEPDWGEFNKIIDNFIKNKP